MLSLIRVCRAPSAFALNVLFPSTTPSAALLFKTELIKHVQADIKVDTLNVNLSLDENRAV